MLYKQYKIIYFQRHGKEDTGTEVEQMTAQCLNGTSFSFMSNKFDAWREQSENEQNFIYKMFLLQITLDTDNASSASATLKMWIKPNVPKAHVQYNFYEGDVPAVKKVDKWAELFSKTNLGEVDLEHYEPDDEEEEVYSEPEHEEEE